MVGEVEVGDHVELDDFPQPFKGERDERAGIARACVRDDQSDIEVPGRPGDRRKDPVAAEAGRDDARLNAVLRGERGGDLLEAVLAAGEEDDVDAAGRRLPRVLLADARRRAGDERPGAVDVLVELLHVSNFRVGAGPCRASVSRPGWGYGC